MWLRSPLLAAGAVAVRSLVYAAVIFPIQYYDLGVKVMGLQSIDTPKEFWSATAYSIVHFRPLQSFSGNLHTSLGHAAFICACIAVGSTTRPEEEAFRAFRRCGRIDEGTAERLGDRRSHTMLDRVFSIATGTRGSSISAGKSTNT